MRGSFNVQNKNISKQNNKMFCNYYSTALLQGKHSKKGLCEIDDDLKAFVIKWTTS